MCEISKLRCTECGYSERYRFKECTDFKRNMLPALSSIPPGLRFHCKNVVWPPDRTSKPYTCEACHWKKSTAEAAARKKEGGELRTRDLAHRFLTVLIPCCPVCLEYRISDFNGRQGFTGVELEPNHNMWSYLLQIRHSQRAETCITTGFIKLPCHVCVQAERMLRFKVLQYPKPGTSLDTAASRFQVWMVYSWLLSRGAPKIAMSAHTALNFGVPDRPPPGTLELLQVMGDTWARCTGLTFVNTTTAMERGNTMGLPVSSHQVPLVDFSQWQSYVDPDLKNMQDLQPPAAIEAMLPDDDGDDAEYRTGPRSNSVSGGTQHDPSASASTTRQGADSEESTSLTLGKRKWVDGAGPSDESGQLKRQMTTIDEITNEEQTATPAGPGPESNTAIIERCNLRHWHLQTCRPDPLINLPFDSQPDDPMPDQQ